MVSRYFDVIKHPMDLGTMESNLVQGQYRTMESFEADMRLIFKNCRTFNHPGTVVVAHGNGLEALFDKEWTKAMEKKLSSADRTFAQKTLTNMIYDEA